MRYLVMTAVFLASLILQSTLFSHLTVAGVKPDLVLMFVILYALLHGPKEGLLIGLLGGLLQDFLFGQFVGMNALPKLTVGYMFGILERKIYKENLLIPIAAIFLGTFINETILYLLRQVSYLLGHAGGTSLNYLESVRHVILSTAVYNSCLAPLIYTKFYKSSQKGVLRTLDG